MKEEVNFSKLVELVQNGAKMSDFMEISDGFPRHNMRESWVVQIRDCGDDEVLLDLVRRKFEAAQKTQGMKLSYRPWND